MPFQKVPNAVMITIMGLLDGQVVNNTLGFSLITPAIVSRAALETIMIGVADYWGVNMLPLLPTQYTYQGVKGRVLDIEDSYVAESSEAAGAPGERVGNLLPNNVTLAIAFKTGLGGRTNRGRNYWPGLLEADVINSAVNGVYAGSVVQMYGDMVGPGQIRPGWVWSVISRKIIDITGEGRAVPVEAVMVNDLVVDSQRRRLPGRGK